MKKNLLLISRLFADEGATGVQEKKRVKLDYVHVRIDIKLF